MLNFDLFFHKTVVTTGVNTPHPHRHPRNVESSLAWKITVIMFVSLYRPLLERLPALRSSDPFPIFSLIYKQCRDRALVVFSIFLS